MDVEDPDLNKEKESMSEKESTFMCNGNDNSNHEDSPTDTNKINGCSSPRENDAPSSNISSKLKQVPSETSDDVLNSDISVAEEGKNNCSELTTKKSENSTGDHLGNSATNSSEEVNSEVKCTTPIGEHESEPIGENESEPISDKESSKGVTRVKPTECSTEKGKNPTDEDAVEPISDKKSSKVVTHGKPTECSTEKGKNPTDEDAVEAISDDKKSSKVVTRVKPTECSTKKRKNPSDEDAVNNKSRSGTPINEPKRCNTPSSEKVKSRSATPVNKKANSRSTTPIQKVKAPESKQAVTDKENVNKKEIKPSKVSQVLKASDEVTNLRPIAQMLFDIGMDVTRQYVYRDLIKIQKKKDTMDKLDSKEKLQLEKLQNAYDNLITKNQSYMNDIITCLHCGFKTDARNILELHKEYAHNQEYNMYTCSFCNETTQVASAFLYHMEALHNRKGRIFMKHAFFICPYCPYESNNRGPFQKHTEKCMKAFRDKNNLIPLAPDCDIPLKAPNKPVAKPSAASEKKVPVRPAQKVVSQSVQELQEAHRAQQARLAAQRNRTIAQVTNAIVQKQTNVVARPSIPYPRPQAIRQISPVQQAQSRMSNAGPANAASNTTGTLVQMNGQWYRLAMVGTQQFLMPVPAPNVNQMPQNRPIVIQSSGTTVPNTIQGTTQKDSDFEVCEICGGFVKDRDSLRIHFHWAHKVDIHKDIFKSPNPPLACVICTKAGKNVKFWTYQGLSRHRSFEHKADKENDTSVSSALMNEIPRKCAVCSHLYSNNTTVQQYWSHMEIHGITPVKLFLLKKCLICGQAMDDSKLLEKHLLTVHSLLFRNIALRNGKDSPSKESPKKGSKPKLTVCNLCTISFETLEAYLRHCNAVHVFQCSRCPDKLSSRETLMKHFHDRHADEKDPCSLCHKMIKIGRPLIRHMKSEHIKKCSVSLMKMSEGELVKYQRKRKIEKNTSSSPQKNANRQNDSRRNSENEVIVIDLDSPLKNGNPITVETSADGEPHAKKQILEVDGEEIVVEIQQDDSEEEIICESIVDPDFETKNDNIDLETKKDNVKEDETNGDSYDEQLNEPDKNTSKHSISDNSNVENIILDDQGNEACITNVVEENSEDDGEVPRSPESMDVS